MAKEGFKAGSGNEEADAFASHEALFPARPHGRFRRLLKRGGRDASGATAIEFAMLAPVVILLLMGIIEFGLIYTADIVLKNATYDAARTGRTGFVENKSTQDKTVLDIVRHEVSAMMDPNKLTIDSKAYAGFGNLNKPEPFIDANKNGRRDNGENYTDVNGNGKYDLDQGRDGFGGANEVVLYTVSYPWKLLTPFVSEIIGDNGFITLTATAVVQNEPYQ